MSGEGPDERLRRLGEALADLARDDAAELLATARQRARSRVGELLEQAMVDALLEQAGATAAREAGSSDVEDIDVAPVEVDEVEHVDVAPAVFDDAEDFGDPSPYADGDIHVAPAGTDPEVPPAARQRGTPSAGPSAVPSGDSASSHPDPLGASVDPLAPADAAPVPRKHQPAAEREQAASVDDDSGFAENEAAERGHEPGRRGLWVYAVIGDRDEDDRPAGLDGVEPDSPTGLVEHEGLTAVVSEVDLDDYGDEALSEHLSDISWVEKRARAHEMVVDQAMAGGAAIPLRLCTIFESAERVREMLDDERDRFSEALGRLGGRAEWGVKLFATGDGLADAARRESDRIHQLEQSLDDVESGHSYLARRQLEREVAQEAERLADELVEDCHARLCELADEALSNPLQRREVSGHDGEMLLNGVYLVADERATDLQRLADELAARHASRGIDVELTGPWPPYHFVGGPLETAG